MLRYNFVYNFIKYFSHFFHYPPFYPNADYKNTKYYKYLMWRKFKSPNRLLDRHAKLVQSMIDNGIIEPLTIGRVEGFKYNENRLVDGDHRYIIAREIGIKKLICRVNEVSS